MGNEVNFTNLHYLVIKSKLLKGHSFWVTETGNMLSSERLRNRAVISVSTETFKEDLG